MPNRLPSIDVPNMLTLSRLVMAGGIWLLRDRPRAMVGVMTAAGVTDLLDGYFARRMTRRRGHMGEWLDPLCDKTFILSVAGAVAATERANVTDLMLVAGRETILLPLLVLSETVPSLRRRRRTDFHADRIGKATTVAQFCALAAMLLRVPGSRVLAATAGVLGAAAAVHYARRALSTSPRERTAPGRAATAAANVA
jgi:cardiolipin synthase (CMP-forming)